MSKERLFEGLITIYLHWNLKVNLVYTMKIQQTALMLAYNMTGANFVSTLLFTLFTITAIPTKQEDFYIKLFEESFESESPAGISVELQAKTSLILQLFL